MARALKDKFRPANPGKYKGDPSNIVYRSSWEFTCMMKFDQNPNVIAWSSEEIQVPYRTVLDEAYEIKNKLAYKRYHRYFVDFYVKIRDRQGKIQQLLIEVKPHKETIEPVRAKFKSEKSFRVALSKWIINSAKWVAAREYAADHNMKFMIYTEKQIYG